MNLHDKGDLVRSTATFTNTAGTATDPTTVVCKVRTPAGVVTTYTYGTDAALVKSATGVYYVDVSLTAVGQWWVRWEGTGTVQQAEEDTFLADESRF